jgi:hypothetical protein
MSSGCRTSPGASSCKRRQSRHPHSLRVPVAKRATLPLWTATRATAIALGGLASQVGLATAARSRRTAGVRPTCVLLASLSVSGVWWTPWRRESGHASMALQDRPRRGEGWLRTRCNQSPAIMRSPSATGNGFRTRSPPFPRLRAASQVPVLGGCPGVAVMISGGPPHRARNGHALNELTRGAGSPRAGAGKIVPRAA